MTFLADDSGAQTSRPLLLFAFTSTLGTVTRRTSHQRDYTFDGHTYLATAGQLTASEVVITAGSDVPEMIVELPISDPLVAAFAGQGTVPQRWTVQVIEIQRTSGEARQYFDGNIRTVDVSVKGGRRVARFTVAGVTSKGIEMAVPTVILSPLCNHTLYDSRCQISRAASSISPTIATIAADFRTITVSSISPFGTADAKFGDVVHPISGEQRSVIDHNGTTLVLDIALPSRGPLSAAPGQTITIAKGCDRQVKTCRDKFNNVGNYGGHPQFIPGNLLWPGRLDGLKGAK